jgi:hypothetical protein
MICWAWRYAETPNLFLYASPDDYSVMLTSLAHDALIRVLYMHMSGSTVESYGRDRRSGCTRSGVALVRAIRAYGR